MKKYVVIPSYKPDEKLIKLTKKLSDKNFFVIIVDDGSGDEYKEIFDSVGEFSEVISYKQNMGKGYALKEGFKYVKKIVTGEAVVVTSDADGQHKLEDIIKISESVRRDTLVLGVRDFDNKDVPMRSKIGNKITSKLFWLSMGVKIEDTQTGLRGFSTNLLDDIISIKGNRYEYEMNMLNYVARSKLNISTISI